MNTNRFLTLLVLAVFAFTFLPSSIGYGQDTSTAGDPPEVMNEPSAVITPVMSYQGRLVESGTPVNGNRSMTFRLYNAAPSGGTLVWQEGPKTITVSNGLFYTALGDLTPFDTNTMNQMDQNLWLEVVVEGVTLPRQRLMGAPYAFSLAAGADIEGNMPAGQSVLKAQNTGGGWGVYGDSANSYGVYGLSDTSHGIYARSTGVGLNGSALLAEAGSSNGIAIWAHSNSADTTLVSSNDGAGPLFKGFGGNGGEHEFIILNDGTVQQNLSASGLVKAGVSATCSNSLSSIARSFNNVGGTITISNGATVGTCVIDFGFQVNDRFFVSQNQGASARNVACGATTPNTLTCFRFDDTGTGINGNIMVLVY